MRAFLAVGLSATMMREYASARAHLSRVFPALRWVRPEHLHITLHFFRDLRDDTAGVLETRLGNSLRAEGSFEIALGELGAFGSRRSPRVFWLAIDRGEEALRSIKRRVDQALGAGVRASSKADDWSPHLTLARAKGRQRTSLDSVRLECRDVLSGLRRERTIVSRIDLMTSELTPGGPVYRLRWSATLGNTKS